MGKHEDSVITELNNTDGSKTGQQTHENARFLRAFDNTSDLITIFKRDGQITYQSPAISRILGVMPESRVGANIFDAVLIHPRDRARNKRFLKNLLLAKPGQELKADFRLRHADGSYRDIEAIGVNLLHDPSLHAVILCSRDVTERKASIQALAESEAKYALTFNNAPIGIAHCEPEDGNFVLVNQYLCDILGYTSDELLNMRFKDITGPDDLKLNVRAVEDIQNGKISDYNHEQRCHRKDGTEVWVNLRMTVQRNARGGVDYFLITVEDISERKRAESSIRIQQELEAKAAVLAEQREQLIAINKAKDEFVSLASHQLRTPATGVKQYVGLLLQGYLGEITQEQQSFLAKAYESNERQLKIINQLLYVARLDAGKVRLEPTLSDLSKLLTDIVDEQHLTFKERGQAITFNVPAKTIMARVDERLIRMAIENLLDNAGKYSPVGKPVLVTLQEHEGNVVIAIRDHGVGIPKKQQSNLFQKFSRIDNPHSIAAGGTGLGLYWAKKIIDLHDGELSLISRPNRGSTFTITLSNASAPQSSANQVKVSRLMN